MQIRFTVMAIDPLGVNVPAFTSKQRGDMTITVTNPDSGDLFDAPSYNDLLDLSKLEAEMMELNLEVVYMPLIIKDACSIIESQASQKRLNLTTSPEPVKPLMVDAQKLRQILYNLLMNAVKYTPAGGSIELGVEDDVCEVRFEVRDTGVGINEEDQERLFQPFIQLENSPDSEFQGAGLGLALVKQLIELHGGRLWVDSQLGMGSTFGFSIPHIEDFVFNEFSQTSVYLR